MKWTASRSESFLGDYYGRDLITEAELAMDTDGHFLALRTHHVANLGTHSVSFVPIARGPTVMNGLYDIAHLETTMQAVFTNTTPVTAYRGAGRPEAIFILERLVDTAAADTGIDRIELRRRNLIAPGRLPYSNDLGVSYDSGDFPRGMQRALELCDWQDFAIRRAAARARGRLAGIGLANYVETSTGWPLERAEMTVHGDGQVQIIIGTQASGQGHETSFAQMVASLLGVPFDSVRLRTGDTDFVVKGSGSHSARSMRVGGHLFVQTADQVIEQGRQVAARMLECAAEDVTFETAVDDAGRVINPLLLEGQVHGGIVQGTGEATHELCVYDAEGQLLTGSFMDYAVPRADEVPFFTVDHNEVPTKTNLLGAKGGGEGGTTPAPAAIVNAVVDALREHGVRDLEMPLTPEKVWRALRG